MLILAGIIAVGAFVLWILIINGTLILGGDIDIGVRRSLLAAWICGLAFIGSCSACSGVYSIDEGEGVVLTQFGRIYDQVNKAGVNYKRPWARTVTWRTRLGTIDQKIESRSKDEMRIVVEATIWWKVRSGKMDKLYATVARDYEVLRDNFVIPGIRSAIRDEVAKVSYETLNSNREKYAIGITKYVGEQLAKKYVIIDKINIRNIIPPEQVNTAIEDKLAMDQKVKKAELEVTLAKKEADIRREEAKGIADAQSIIQRKLTPMYLQWHAIEMQKKLAGSPNTTFYFVPMSKNSGIPMIYGGPGLSLPTK
jgi:regulator of protease activity HflC (stomatin/prohibitin superfamily)